VTTDDDRALLMAIAKARDPVVFADLVAAFYRDADRADRTPRWQLYLHLGMACGVIMRLVAAAGWQE
jgi:hypothetical protein